MERRAEMLFLALLLAGGALTGCSEQNSDGHSSLASGSDPSTSAQTSRKDESIELYAGGSWGREGSTIRLTPNGTVEVEGYYGSYAGEGRRDIYNKTVSVLAPIHAYSKPEGLSSGDESGLPCELGVSDADTGYVRWTSANGSRRVVANIDFGCDGPEVDALYLYILGLEKLLQDEAKRGALQRRKIAETLPLSAGTG